RRHRDLGEIYGQSEETVQSAAAYAQRHLGVVADLLNDQDYLMLDRFGLPDILLMSCLDWASFYGVAIPDNLTRYRHNIARRSAYQKAMSINYKNLMGANNGTAIGS
ncbi:MAG: glutathione binding-like protein, partial [Pseudomonadota bacterium]